MLHRVLVVLLQRPAILKPEDSALEADPDSTESSSGVKAVGLKALLDAFEDSDDDRRPRVSAADSHPLLS